jgi:hypothetical protein
MTIKDIHLEKIIVYVVKHGVLMQAGFKAMHGVKQHTNSIIFVLSHDKCKLKIYGLSLSKGLS